MLHAAQHSRPDLMTLHSLWWTLLQSYGVIVNVSLPCGVQQVTSLFLHWFPACVAWTERWHPQVQPQHVHQKPESKSASGLALWYVHLKAEHQRRQQRGHGS